MKYSIIAGPYKSSLASLGSFPRRKVHFPAVQFEQIIRQRDGRTELSYDFLPDFWGNGYAREAVARALEWIRTNAADDTLEVIAVTQEANTPSRRLLEALGARQTESMIEFGAPQAVYTFARIA